MCPTSRGKVLCLLVSLTIVGGCAGRPLFHPGDTRGGTQLVATDEPLERNAGPSLPPQPAELSAPDPLLAAMARMVANGGEWRSLAWKDAEFVGGTRCGPSVSRVSALAPADPRAALAYGWWPQSWVAVGLTYGTGTRWVGPLAGRCGGAHVAAVATSQGGMLAPAVSGRDTSVLFTTRRANVSEAPGSGLVDAIVEQFVAPRSSDGESRRAVPRFRPRG